MSKTVRAKFNLAELTKYGNGGGGRVILYPVTGYNEENKKFWDATPSGKIELFITNKEAIDGFEFGEYYIDFTPVENA